MLLTQKQLNGTVDQLAKLFEKHKRPSKYRKPLFPDGWLTPAQAAEMLGMSAPAVKYWVKVGRLQATTLPNGHLAIWPAELAKTVHAWRSTK